MTFQVELTPIAERQIEKAYQWYRDRNPEFADRWFRSVMNRISTLQVQPRRWALAVEHEIFPKRFGNFCMSKPVIFTEFYLRFEK